MDEMGKQRGDRSTLIREWEKERHFLKLLSRLLPLALRIGLGRNWRRYDGERR